MCQSLNHSHHAHYISAFGSGLYYHYSTLKKEVPYVCEKLVPIYENTRPVILGDGGDGGGGGSDGGGGSGSGGGSGGICAGGSGSGGGGGGGGGSSSSSSSSNSSTSNSTVWPVDIKQIFHGTQKVDDFVVYLM